MKTKLAPGNKKPQINPEWALKSLYENEVSFVSKYGRATFENTVLFWKRKMGIK